MLAEHAGSGSAVAAPVARKVMDQYLLGEVQYDVPAPVIAPYSGDVRKVSGAP